MIEISKWGTRWFENKVKFSLVSHEASIVGYRYPKR